MTSQTFSEWYDATFDEKQFSSKQISYEVWAHQQEKIDKLAAVIHMLDYVHNGNPPKALYGKGGIAIIDGARKFI